MPEPLVLIPGMMCDARVFAPQIAEISKTRSVMVAMPLGARTIPELARKVLAEAPPRFALAGLSMGGIIAMEIIRQAPDRVSRLALIGTEGGAETDFTAERRAPQIARVLGGELEPIMRDEVIPYFFFDRTGLADEKAICLDMASGLGPELFETQSRALMQRPDQTPGLADINVSTLVLCGAKDVMCPVEKHEEIARAVQGASLVVVPEAGHVVTLEAPDATTVALKTWLA